MPRPRKTFTGEYVVPLEPCDGAVRLRLPAAWRAPDFREAAFLVRATGEGGLWIFSPQGVQRLLRKARRLDQESIEVHSALRRLFGKAYNVVCDETHTLTLQADWLRQFTRLGATVRLIGQQWRIEAVPEE
ncbi:MAG: hypothetical protein JJT96_10850 [Opitutales bacterium]|nr:hypothetical protein [Opitutales bacterium]